MNKMQGLMGMVSAMQGGNPAQMFQQIAAGNPQLKPIVDAINSGTPVDTIADNMLKDAGMTREQAVGMLRQLGIKF